MPFIENAFRVRLDPDTPLKDLGLHHCWWLFSKRWVYSKKKKRLYFSNKAFDSYINSPLSNLPSFQNYLKFKCTFELLYAFAISILETCWCFQSRTHITCQNFSRFFSPSSKVCIASFCCSCSWRVIKVLYSLGAEFAGMPIQAISMRLSDTDEKECLPYSYTRKLGAL